MKRARNFLLFVFLVFSLFLVKPREDVVFAAINTSQCIRLYENGMDFELCNRESKRFTGTYNISKDTIFLFYQDQLNLLDNTRKSVGPEVKKKLPLKLVINKEASRVTSAAGASFSAQVYLDARRNSLRSRENSMGLLNHQKSATSMLGAPWH